MDEVRGPQDDKGGRSRQDAAGHDAQIEWFYDVALDPVRMETLVDEWENALKSLRSLADFAAPDILNDRNVLRHFARATAILAKFENDTTVDQIELILSPFKSVSAVVVDQDLNIRKANENAVADLGLGKQINTLPLEPADIEQLMRAMRALFAKDREDTAILSFRLTHSQQITVFRLQLFHTSDNQRMILLAANGISWPTGLNGTLTQVFGLTPAETEVLRSLVEAGSINDIAIARGRSVDTIRGQVKSIMAKNADRVTSKLLWPSLDSVLRFHYDAWTHPDQRTRCRRLPWIEKP